MYTIEFISNNNYIYMAHLHNTSRHTKPSWLTRLGNKVKTAAELAGTAKGIWDVAVSYTHLTLPTIYSV